VTDETNNPFYRETMLFVVEDRLPPYIEDWRPMAPHAYLSYDDAVSAMDRILRSAREYEYRVVAWERAKAREAR